MSCSKLLTSKPITYDILCYLNRNQLERFSIVCRRLKDFIERHFGSKPYRVFDQLIIRGGLYALENEGVRWHPNRYDYSVQQFMAGKKCWIDFRCCIESRRMANRMLILAGQPSNNNHGYYSLAKMRPYLLPTVRIKNINIYVAGDSTYNPEHIGDMESIAFLWHDHDIYINNEFGNRIVASDFQPILNSPSILQCQSLVMINAHFSFKDFNILYEVQRLVVRFGEDETDIDRCHQFLEQSVAKPVVVIFCHLRQNTATFIDRLSEAFSSAVSPNAFKIILFPEYNGPLTEFRKTNKISGEILELKKAEPLASCDNYTLERFSI